MFQTNSKIFLKVGQFSLRVCTLKVFIILSHIYYKYTSLAFSAFNVKLSYALELLLRNIF